MKAYWGSRSMASCILHLDTTWWWVVSFTTRPLYPQGSSPCYPLDRRLGEPQSQSGLWARYTHTPTYPMVHDIIWKGDSHSVCQKIPSFLYGTRRFITVFTIASHWTLFWASRIQFSPSIPISLRSNLMLSSHLCLGLPSGLLPSGFPTKPCKHLLTPYSRIVLEKPTVTEQFKKFSTSYGIRRCYTVFIEVRHWTLS
jgi:hypothetical protein